MCGSSLQSSIERRFVTYYERYLNGDHEGVWKQLQDLGSDVRLEPHFSDACAVAAETMRRVQRNCERIVSRLRSMGYSFNAFPDGSRRHYVGEPLVRPSQTFRTDCDELESQAGPLPISLTAFWQEVGAVDFVGRCISWPDGLDPLVVDPPEGALSFLYEEEDEVGDMGWFAGLAPDDLHKDNTSGGDPYGVNLPNPSADFRFVNERHDLLFVSYLRLAILRYGGFPGLDDRRLQFEPLRALAADLEPF